MFKVRWVTVAGSQEEDFESIEKALWFIHELAKNGYEGIIV